jgi:hypothetical protein
VKLVTYTTPSHAAMCKEFVLDRAELAGFADDDIILIEDIQRCGSGNYNDEGFVEQCASKIANLASLPLGEQYFYCDADCCLFPGLRWWVNTQIPDILYLGNDIVQQCAGVMLWSHDKKTRRLFEIVADLCGIYGKHDQQVFNLLYQGSFTGRFPVRAETMPSKIIANYASLQGKVVYWNGQDFDVPSTVRLFHANFTVGVDKKQKLLEKVASSVATIAHC